MRRMGGLVHVEIEQKLIFKIVLPKYREMFLLSHGPLLCIVTGMDHSPNTAVALISEGLKTH